MELQKLNLIVMGNALIDPSVFSEEENLRSMFSEDCPIVNNQAIDTHKHVKQFKLQVRNFSNLEIFTVMLANSVNIMGISGVNSFVYKFFCFNY